MQNSTMSTMTEAPRLSFTQMIGSTDPFPILKNLNDTFIGKGIRTVFMTIGNSQNAGADLELAETLGCPIHAVPLTARHEDEWAEVSKILKARVRENPIYPFSAGAESKWILPKNILVHKALPWWMNGTVDLSNGTMQTVEVMSMIQNICGNMKVKDGSTRLDILKLDTVSAAPGLEKALLGAVLNAGFRPAVVIVNWSKRPDVELATTIAAGHLQNAGYRLMEKLDNKFLYYFTDHDMYQICSWEDTSYHNPMMNEIVSSSLPQQKPAQKVE